MLLLTAANGNQGKLIASKLAASGVAFRALVRSERSADLLRNLGAAEVIAGDMASPEVLERSLEGVEKVYHIGPTLHPREREIGFEIISAAARSGVKHFVFSSVLHAIASDLVQHAIKRDIEEHLLKSGLEYTILQPCNYMLPLKLKPAFAEGVFKLSWALERRQSLVDLEDIAEVAVEVLTDCDRHAGATYELVGEGRYTACDIAGILARVTGKIIRAERISPDVYMKAWFGADDPRTRPHEFRTLTAITEHYSAHDFIGNPNVLTWLLGRPPGSFESFARREFESYRRQAAGSSTHPD